MNENKYNNNDSEIKESRNEPFEVNEARLAAVKILSRFERSDAYLDKLLSHKLEFSKLNNQDKALLHELVYGVIRWRWKLDWVLTGFYRGDYLKCLNIIKNALRVGLYQILFLDKIPDHAAINESVEIIKNIQGEKIAGVVNGVLRSISRNIENIRYPKKNEDIVYYYTVMESHPRWMIKRWIQSLGEEDTIKLLKANNRRSYTRLRINTLKTSSVDIMSRLYKLGISFYQSTYLDDSLVIRDRGVNISTFEIFNEGLVSVQDTSASLATKLAQAKENDRIIDLCAAPGGKSFGLAEQIKDKGEIISLDKYPSKLRFIDEGAKRLGITSIKTVSGDAVTYQTDNPFDIVFADVPCSGLGTISKKPDIKWKRDIDDIPLLVNTQREILKNAAKLVKVGGTLVYSTCTIDADENEGNIHWFLQEFPEFEVDPAENYLPENVCKNGFLQSYPFIHNFDGAFAARLIKKS